MNLAGAVIYALASLGLIALFWKSARQPGGYGFFRLIAFECVLGLAVNNVPFWFVEPFAIRQIVSWVLLVASGFLVIHGFYLLKTVGRPVGPVEHTTALVKRGAYRYIRHPLYSSVLYLAWGAFLKHATLPTAALALVATAALYATARAEERENLGKFGDTYREYMRESKMFLPLIF